MDSLFVLFLGILSAYAMNPTVGTIEYRQELGQLPEDLSEYEAFVAVNDCSLIGHEATLYAMEEEFKAIVFDCAGADGVDYFSKGNDLRTPYKLSADVDYFFWKAYPEIVHSVVLIEVER